jgi:hypothetical protein
MTPGTAIRGCSGRRNRGARGRVVGVFWYCRNGRDEHCVGNIECSEEHHPPWNWVRVTALEKFCVRAAYMYRVRRQSKVPRKYEIAKLRKVS